MFKFLKSILIALVVACVCSAGFGAGAGSGAGSGDDPGGGSSANCVLGKDYHFVFLDPQGATVAGDPSSVNLRYGSMWVECTNGVWSSVNVMTTLPQKTGYTFGGYYTGVNGVGTQVVDSSGNFLQTEAALTAYDSDGTMYAKWNPKILTVTLNHQNATTTGTPATVYLKYGAGWYSNSGATTSISQMTQVPTRTNYTFGGYYTGTNGTGVQVIDATGAFKTTSAALTALSTNGTVYAKWVAGAAPVYAINLNSNNGVAGGRTVIYEMYNVGFYRDRYTQQTISSSVFAPVADGGADITRPTAPASGGVFNGYWTSEQEGGTQIINRQGELLVEPNYFSAATTIYAHWDAIYTVLDFDFGNGTDECGGTQTTVNAFYDEDMPAISCSPTPPLGHHFLGFYDLNGVQYYDYFLSSVRPWDKRVDFYTLVAQYAPNNYKISYYCGNSSAVIDPVYFGGSYTFRSLNDVGCSTPYGHTFQHWLGDDGNTYDENETISNWGYTESLILTPVFRGADYTITLDNASATTNGATTLYTTYNTNVYRDSARTQAMTTSANPITTPSRVYTITYDAHSGTMNTTAANTTATYTFNGYYSASSGGTQYINADGYITLKGLDTGINYQNNSYIWRAQWTSASVILPTPSRMGYTFNGWYDAATGGNLIGVGGASYTPTANTTLHAHWTPNTYTITYDLAGGSLGNNVTNPTTYNITTASFTLNNPNRTGYTFAGWTVTTAPSEWGTGSSSSGATTFTVGSGTYGNIAFAATWSPNVSGAIQLDAGLYASNSASSGTQSTTAVSPDTVYSRYDDGMYASQANANIGTNPIASITTNPTLTGYTFDGFWTTKATGGTKVINADKTFTADADNQVTVSGDGGIWYAHWAPSTYIITLNDITNGGNAGNGTVNEVYNTKWTNHGGDTITSVSIPEKTNHVFTGYYTAASGGTQKIPASGVLPATTTFTSNTTLFSQYQECTCTPGAHSTCAVTGVSNNQCQYSFSCNSGYNYNGTGGDTFTGSAGVGATTGPACVGNTIYLTWANGGHGTAPSTPATCTYGDNFTTAAAITGVTGYNFNKWSVNGKTFNASTSIGCNNTNLGVTSGSATLTATWDVGEYSISLNNANATTNGTGALYTKYDTGVYLDSNRTQAMSFATNPITVPQRAYTVSYNAHGGSVSTTSANTSSVYNFDGYYNAANGNTQYIGLAGLDPTIDGISAGNWYWVNDWSVVYPYGEIIGQSFCSSQSGGSAEPYVYVGSIPDSSVQTAVQTEYNTVGSLNPDENRDHCYCKLNTPYSEQSPWVYWGRMRESLEFYAECVVDCPLYCQRLAYGDTGTNPPTYGSNPTAFRTMLFSGLSASGMGYITDAGLTAGKGYSSNSNTWYAKWSGGSVTLPTPTYAGYTFNGWYDAATGGNLIGVGGASYTPTANTTLHAHWTPNTYTITYDLAGGSLGNNVINPTTYNVTTASFTLNNPTRTGYTFAGWTVTTAPSEWGTGSSSSGATTFTVGSGTYGNIAFTGTWTVNGYNITLNNTNATTNGTSTLYTRYDTGVYLDSNRTQAMNFATNPITVPQRAYTVSYNAHGGNVSTTSANTSSVYNFDGYYNAADGNTQYIGLAGLDATVDGTDWCIWPETPGACDYTPMEPMDYNEWSVVYPYGEIIGQSFCSSQNGGSAGDWTYAGSVPGSSVQTAVQNEYTTSGGGINSTGDHCYCKLKAPNSNSSSWVYLGYMPYGGYVTSDCTVQCPLACAAAAYGMDNILDNNAQSHAPAFRTMLFSGLSANGMGYITSAGLTAGKGYSSNSNTWYAKWSGGSVTLPTPTYAGYTFNGWYDAATGGNLVGLGGASYTPTANITLHAHWTPNTYSVTYSCGTGATGTAPAAGTATYNEVFDAAATPNTCAKAGHVFAGWRPNAEETNWINGATWTYTTNKTFTAQWFVPSFQIDTTNLSANDTFNFSLGAEGTFYVDCGEDGVLSGYGVAGNTITAAGNYTNYTCTYSTGNAKTIKFGGTATDYRDDGTEAIKFNTASLIASVSGNLSTMFPYIYSNSADGAQPRFHSTFENAINLTGVPDTLFADYTAGARNMFHNTFGGCTSLTTIPSGLFSGITTGAYGMFRSTFEGCTSLTTIPSNLFSGITTGAYWMFGSTFEGCTSLTTIPSNLFSGITTGADWMFGSTFEGCTSLTTIPPNLFSGITTGAYGMFTSTFEGCTNLGGYIPPTAFAGLVANGSPVAPLMWFSTFENTQVSESCPSNMRQYITGYENTWDGRVSCGYNVTYSCGSGTTSSAPASPSNALFLGQSYTPVANTCAKAGYTFDGWQVSNTNPAEIKPAGAAFAWNYTENKTFTAQWSLSVSSDIQLDSGFYVSNTSSTGIAATTGVSPDTVYSRYDDGMYATQADANAGTNPITAITTKPTLTGYDFDGFWTTKAIGGTKVINTDKTFTADADNQISTSGEGAIWYAHWTPNTYSMQYTCNDADLGYTYAGTAPVAQMANYLATAPLGQNAVLPGIGSCKKVYGTQGTSEYCDNCFDFVGWVVNAEETALSPQPATPHAAGTTIPTWGKTDNTTWCKIAGVNDDWGSTSGACEGFTDATPFTVRPVYDPKTYTLSYGHVSGTGNTGNRPNAHTYTTTTSVSAADLSLTHGSFVGWCADDSTLQNCTNGTDISVGPRNYGNHTYYAKWACDAGYELSYDANDNPVCTAASITCNSGYYLPASGTSSADCMLCLNGNYCEGGIWTYDGTAHGLTACPTGYVYGGTGLSAQNQCKALCGAGQCLSTENGQCMNVGAGNWSAGGLVAYGSTLECNACATGLTTIGFGNGADESNDCGRVLHFGDYHIYLRQNRKTERTLNVKIGDTIFYGNMSTDDINMGYGINHQLKAKVGDIIYSIYDDSAEAHQSQTNQ